MRNVEARGTELNGTDIGEGMVSGEGPKSEYGGDGRVIEWEFSEDCVGEAPDQKAVKRSLKLFFEL